MKKILTISLLILFSTMCFSQEPQPAPTITKEDLLKKSKKQKVTGWIMLGAGAVAFVSGAIIFDQSFSIFDDQNELGLWTGGGLVLIGSVSMVGSAIPFIKSGKNRRKAMEMSAGFKLEKGMPDIQKSMQYTYYPSVSVKIHLK